MKNWDVLAIAGPSGVGKSRVSYPLAKHFGVSVSEVDDLFHAIEAVTTPTQLLNNYLAREPDEGKQRKRAQISRLFGDWLRSECERLGLIAIPARPWETVLDRVIAEAGV